MAAPGTSSTFVRRCKLLGLLSGAPSPVDLVPVARALDPAPFAQEAEGKLLGQRLSGKAGSADGPGPTCTTCAGRLDREIKLPELKATK